MPTPHRDPDPEAHPRTIRWFARPDHDGPGGVIRITVGRVDALRAHRGRMAAEGWDVGSGFVFVSPEGSYVRQPAFRQRVLRPILKAAGLPVIRPYDLRHTSATLLLANDVNIRVVSERLGHSDIATTLRHYAHALPSLQRRAATTVQTLFGNVSPPVVPTAQTGANGHVS